MASKTCPHCGAEMNPYKVTVTPMMINALIKFRQAVAAKGENSVHLLHDMHGNELTKHEWNNFTRQRFLGLAVKDKKKAGYWLLTKRGADFLNGQSSIPSYVLVLRNRIVDRSTKFIYLRDVFKLDVPYMETIVDIEYISPVVDDIEVAIAEMDRPYKMVIGEDNIARKVYE